MGSLAVPLLIGGSLLQFGSGIVAGNAAKNEAELTAKQLGVEAEGEKVGAIQREADRKNRLAAAMASQIAGAGAKGVAAFEGSPLSVLQEDIKTEETATQRDLFNTRMGVLSKRASAQGVVARGKTQSRVSKLRGGFGLLTGLGQAAQVA